MIAKMESHCPVGEKDWRTIDKHFKGKIITDEYEHGQKMSLLALWIKTHTRKEVNFLSNTITEDFLDDVKAKVEELRMMHPKMSEQELEDEAFQQTMYRDEIPNRLVGYGLGVKKGDIYGVRGVLRKEGRVWKSSKEGYCNGWC
uniref:Uncharacterized protein n=1 Tax=Chenopodium quinoa TaxID=63459 RepID=A0A803KV17_CHEQI